jgi:hypothetical protein
LFGSSLFGGGFLANAGDLLRVGSLFSGALSGSTNRSWTDGLLETALQFADGLETVFHHHSQEPLLLFPN